MLQIYFLYRYLQYVRQTREFIRAFVHLQPSGIISRLENSGEQTVYNIKFIMFLMRCRRHTCKIVIVTSLVWCLLDMLILLSYSDCTNGVGFGCSDTDTGKKGAIKHSNQVYLDTHGREVEEYPRSKLRSWTQAKTVPKQKGHPGEMGKSVQIPPDREQEKKEKFPYGENL